MSQSATHPHHVSNLLEPALIEIVQAVSDRPNQTMAEYAAKADANWALVESFQPRDVIDLLLSGQLIAFNAVFADAAGGLLRGMDDTAKKQTVSSLVAMGRVTQGHVDRLAKRGNQPYLSVVAAPQPTARPAVPPGPPPDARPEAAAADTALEAPPAITPGAEPPPAAASPAAAPSPAAVPLPVRAPEPPSECEPAPCHAPGTARTPPHAGDPPPAAEASWLDEPYQEYVVETPGLLLAREQMAQTAAIFALAEASLRDIDATAPQADALPDPKAS